MKSTKTLTLLLGFFSLTFTLRAAAEVTWQAVDANITFIKQAERLKYFDSNQVILAGKECLAIFDASGDFSQVELMASQIKTQFTQPVCYLIASHPHDDHLLGMAVLQHAFPDAKLITHSKVSHLFTQYQQTLSDKLTTFSKSIALNEKRMEQLEPEQQVIWHDKITKAKERVKRWQQLTLQRPTVEVEQQTTLNLGDYPIELIPVTAHSAGDLIVYLPNSKFLLSGDVGDVLPYAGEGILITWLQTLKTLQTLPATKLIPGHGDITTVNSLTTTHDFLSALQAHANKAASENWPPEKLIQSFDFNEKATLVKTELDEKAYRMFVETGLKQAAKQVLLPTN